MGDLIESVKTQEQESTTYKNTREKLFSQIGKISEWVPTFLRKIEKTKFGSKAPTIEFFDNKGILKESASLWKEIFDKVDFQSFLSDLIETKHELGVAFVSVQMKNGIPYPFIVDQVIPSWSGRELILIKASFQLAIGGGVWLRIHEKANKYKSVRRFEMLIPKEDAPGEFDVVQEDDFTEEMKKDVIDSGWSKEWIHNLGYVPYFPVYNIRAKNNLGETDLQGHTTLLNYLDESWLRSIWELRMNRNMLEVYRQKLPGGVNKKTIGEEIENAIDSYNPWVETASAAWSQGAETNFDIKRTVSEVLSQSKHFTDALTLVLEAAGYKRDSGDDGKSAQQNDTEILQIRDSEIRTFKTKQRNLESGLRKIVQCMIDLDINSYIWTNVKEIRVSVPFLQVRNETSAIDNAIKMVKEGIMTKVQAIAKVQEVSEADAESIDEDVKKEKEANMPAPIDPNNENNVDTGVDNGNAQNREA